MLFLRSSTTDAAVNLATEQWLQEQALPPVFFLYQNAPAVIVGKYQNVYAETDPAALRRDHVPVFRRCSGGGAVYHDAGNFNLCFVETLPPGTDLSHDRYVQPLVQALRALGIPADKQRSCDIGVGGDKVSGSAQCVHAGRTLHHCTLLFDTDLAALERYLRGNGGLVSRAVASVRSPVTDLCRYYRGGREQFEADLLRALFPQGMQPLDLTAEQTEQIRRLAQEKYRTWAWNYAAGPAFTAATARGTVRVERGVVVDCGDPACLGRRYEDVIL